MRSGNKFINTFSFTNDEISAREFDFSIFIILMCTLFRNFYNGNGFKIHFDGNLFFELTLLLLPISLMLVKHKSDKEIANIFRGIAGLLFLIVINVIIFLIGLLLLRLSIVTPIIFREIFSVFGLAIVITAILNFLISTLIITLKAQRK